MAAKIVLFAERKASLFVPAAEFRDMQGEFYAIAKIFFIEDPADMSFYRAKA